MRVLFLSDRSLAEAMISTLEEVGISVEVLTQPEQAELRALSPDFEAVLIDQNHFKEPCYWRLHSWRRAGLKAHVLVLLDRDSTSEQRADCLDAGADAYLLSPLTANELRAHLRVVQRREEKPASTIRRVHDMEINNAVRTVKRGGRTIRLTPREFELLQFLAYHQGRVVSRSMIRQYLYSGEGEDGNLSNVVDVYVRYLRNKIDKGFDQPLILTRWGQGYLLRAEGV